MKKKLLNGTFYGLLVLNWIANLYAVIFTLHITLSGLGGKYGIRLFRGIRSADWFKKCFELGQRTGLIPFYIGIALGFITVAILALYDRDLNKPAKALLIINPTLAALSFTEFFFIEFSVVGFFSGNPFPHYSVISFVYPAVFLAMPIAITVLAVRDRKWYAQLYA